MSKTSLAPGARAAVTLIAWGAVEPPILYVGYTGELPAWCRWWFAVMAALFVLIVVGRAAKASIR